MKHLRVGQRAWIFLPEFDPVNALRVSIEWGKIDTFEKFNCLEFVEVFVCNRIPGSYKLAFVEKEDFVKHHSEADANSISTEWDKPFPWEGMIASNKLTLLRNHIEEVDQIIENFKGVRTRFDLLKTQICNTEVKEVALDESEDREQDTYDSSLRDRC